MKKIGPRGGGGGGGAWRFSLAPRNQLKVPDFLRFDAAFQQTVFTYITDKIALLLSLPPDVSVMSVHTPCRSLTDTVPANSKILLVLQSSNKSGADPGFPVRGRANPLGGGANIQICQIFPKNFK